MCLVALGRHSAFLDGGKPQVASEAQGVVSAVPLCTIVRTRAIIATSRSSSRTSECYVGKRVAFPIAARGHLFDSPDRACPGVSTSATEPDALKSLFRGTVAEGNSLRRVMRHSASSSPCTMQRERATAVWCGWLRDVQDTSDHLVRDPIDAGKHVQACTATCPTSDLHVPCGQGGDGGRTAGMNGGCSSGTSRLRHREVGRESCPPLLAESVARCMESAYSTPLGSAANSDALSVRFTLLCPDLASGPIVGNACSFACHSPQHTPPSLAGSCTGYQTALRLQGHSFVPRSLPVPARRPAWCRRV
jgi:hypothetical protein